MYTCLDAPKNSPVISQCGIMLSMVIEALSVYLPDSLNRALLRVVPFARV